MGNIAKIASCKCNKQQDQGELDLNKDKQDLLKNYESNKIDGEGIDYDDYQDNCKIDSVKNGDIGAYYKQANKNDLFNDKIINAEEGTKCMLMLIYCPFFY